MPAASMATLKTIQTESLEIAYVDGGIGPGGQWFSVMVSPTTLRLRRRDPAPDAAWRSRIVP